MTIVKLEMLVDGIREYRTDHAPVAHAAIDAAAAE
jgi:hypothetical protein